MVGLRVKVTLDWVIDILRGRLLIFAMFNPGRVAVAMENLGSRTQDGKGKAYMRAFAEFDAGGATYLAQMPLGDSITEMMMEARSLAHVTEVAQTLAEGIQEQLPIMMRDDELIE